MRIVSISLLFLATGTVWAKDHVARIVKLEAAAEIFVPISGKATPQDRLVKYLDRTFRIANAEKGMKLGNGSVVNTGPSGKLKIVFNNGDHFYISPNTQYVLNWKQEYLKEDEDPSTMTLLRGAVRGLVEKGGPRSGMKVITKTTTMGVRGTDFHVAQFGSGLTQISVIRGSITVTADRAVAPLVVESGKTLLKKQENVELSALTKTELREITQTTAVASGPVRDPELKELEEKSLAATLTDLKTYEPAAYEELIADQKAGKIGQLSAETVALTTVKKLEQTAPESKKKPGWAELLQDEDPYEKYRPKTDNP